MSSMMPGARQSLPERSGPAQPGRRGRLRDTHPDRRTPSLHPKHAQVRPGVPRRFSPRARRWSGCSLRRHAPRGEQPPAHVGYLAAGPAPGRSPPAVRFPATPTLQALSINLFCAPSDGGLAESCGGGLCSCLPRGVACAVAVGPRLFGEAPLGVVPGERVVRPGESRGPHVCELLPSLPDAIALL